LGHPLPIIISHYLTPRCLKHLICNPLACVPTTCMACNANDSDCSWYRMENPTIY